jgi:hypothetical protein
VTTCGRYSGDNVEMALGISRRSACDSRIRCMADSSPEAVTVCPEKWMAVKEWQPPRDKHESGFTTSKIQL